MTYSDVLSNLSPDLLFVEEEGLINLSVTDKNSSRAYHLQLKKCITNHLDCSRACFITVDDQSECNYELMVTLQEKTVECPGEKDGYMDHNIECGDVVLGLKLPEETDFSLSFTYPSATCGKGFIRRKLIFKDLKNTFINHNTPLKIV